MNAIYTQSPRCEPKCAAPCDSPKQGRIPAALSRLGDAIDNLQSKTTRIITVIEPVMNVGKSEAVLGIPAPPDSLVKLEQTILDYISKIDQIADKIRLAADSVEL